MSDAEAIGRLEKAAGTEFDVAIVKAFIATGVHAREEEPNELRSLRNLEAAVERDTRQVVAEDLPK
jgi:hypothetical protein